MKYLFRLTFLVVLLISAQACTEILEETEPSTALSDATALSDEDAVLAIRANMYGRLHSFTFTTRNMLGPESLGDQLTNRDGSSRFQGYAQNELNVTMNDGSYSTIYGLIQDANILYSGIADGVLSDAQLAQIRGEALALRAYAMHAHVKAMGYDPTAPDPGGSWDLGIIIRTEPVLGLSAADERPRNTVAEVYTQIVADLNESITLLTANPITNNNFVTAGFAEGLLARVQLYNGNYAAAATAAANARAATSARLATAGEVATMFDESVGANPEGIFILRVDPATESQGINSSLNAYTANQWVAQVPTADLIAQYDPADARLAGWYSQCDNEVTAVDDNSPGIAISGCNTTNTLFPPSGLELNKWNAETNTLFADDVPMMRVSELVLIQAEAALRNTGGAAAVPFLDEIRAARGVAAYAGATDNTTVLNEILAERRRELVGEGHRFFDLKRLGRDIIKGNQPTDKGLPTVPFTDIRILGDYDIDDLEDNPSLIQNPGY